MSGGRVRECGYWHPEGAVEHNRPNCWLRRAATYLSPPGGWLDYGAHYDNSVCQVAGPLTFSNEKGPDGLPRWERHDGCELIAPAPSGSTPDTGDARDDAMAQAPEGPQ